MRDMTYFYNVRKYHLDKNDMSFNGVKITDKDISTRMEEIQIMNGDNKNDNCKRKASGDNTAWRKT